MHLGLWPKIIMQKHFLVQWGPQGVLFCKLNIKTRLAN